MAWIGLDQSYTGFGLVILLDGDDHPHDRLGKFDAAKFGSGVDRLLFIEEWLATEIGDYVIDWVCMEGYANGSKFGREAAGELGYAVKRYLRSRHPQRLLPTVVPPTSVKKFATGSGAAKKNEMLLAVYKRWGVEYKNDNLADAFVLAKIAQALSDPDARALAKFQEDVLAKLSD